MVAAVAVVVAVAVAAAAAVEAAAVVAEAEAAVVAHLAPRVLVRAGASSSLELGPLGDPDVVHFTHADTRQRRHDKKAEA